VPHDKNETTITIHALRNKRHRTFAAFIAYDHWISATISRVILSGSFDSVPQDLEWPV